MSPVTKSFRIEGQIQREHPEVESTGVKLMAYAFDKAGTLLGSAELDNKGSYSVAVPLASPADVELLVGPAGMPQQIRQSSAYRKSFTVQDWKTDSDQFRVRYDAVLPLPIWRPWWPLRICVSGHVRKIEHHDGTSETRPVPFAKIEIFDVDREGCIWPLVHTWWERLFDRPVIRLPELVKQPPVPPQPFPDPAVALNLGRIAREAPRMLPGLITTGSLTPEPAAAAEPATAGFLRVGEARTLEASIASKLDKLTITSKVPPWSVFPRCFFSTAKIGEATTDCNGYFACCFNWFPFHFRRGRLRFDSRPDIIVKVTQVIDGVATVIYLDPYTSTRWNVTNAHLDLFLDDEDVVSGSGCRPQPEQTAVFFTRVGNDEVHDIDQTTGTYHAGGFSNVAYGDRLELQALFGKGLVEATEPHYYRLSIAPGNGLSVGPFTPLAANLADTRVDRTTLKAESHTLGPQVVNGEPALYEIRDMSHYYWYWPDHIGSWFTPTDVPVPNAGLYTVRLEVFDKNGAKLTSSTVDYRDGTAVPPAVLPPMKDHCDLVLQIDNAAPDITLDVPKAGNICGVVKFADVPFDIDATINQVNHRLHSWNLSYVKGLSGVEVPLAGATNPAGLSPVPQIVDEASTPFTNGLTTTCAFSLILDASSNVRNGYSQIYSRRLIKAIAVEKCG